MDLKGRTMGDGMRYDRVRCYDNMRECYPREC